MAIAMPFGVIIALDMDEEAQGIADEGDDDRCADRDRERRGGDEEQPDGPLTAPAARCDAEVAGGERGLGWRPVGHGATRGAEAEPGHPDGPAAMPARVA